jgi:hypothetical protein
MRRIMLMVTVALVMAAMMLAMACPFSPTARGRSRKVSA